MASNSFRSLTLTAQLYIAATVIAGAITVAQSIYTLIREPASWQWLILALLTLVSGSATVRLASLPASISISETFVFTSVLLFGGAAGTITVALDALVISFWSYRKGDPPFKIIFNVCAASLAIWLSAQLFFFLTGIDPIFRNPDTIRIRQIVIPLIAFTLAYWGLNSWLIAFAISLEKRMSALAIWRDNFVLLSLNYFGGASVAALLVSYTKELDYTFLALILPLLLVLYFTFSTSMGRVEDANRHLSQLNALYMSTIETLAMAIDAKDQITHGHIRRVQTYAVGLAQHMGVSDQGLIRAIEAAALLHDMGKLAVPEYILNKPGPLTLAEFEKMKLHASVGADILSAINFPYPVVPIVRHHHENWNGTGYPNGLAGADIPMGARILAVVDCFDALTSDRPYRPRLSDKDALKILVERRGTMYDPLVVDTFIKVHAQIGPTETARLENVPLNAITQASVTSSSPASIRFDEISGSTEEMLTLFDLARSLSAQMSLQDAGDMVAKHLRRLIPSSLTVFFVYQVDTDELLAGYCAGENSVFVGGMRIGVGQRLSGWVAAHRQSIRNADPVLDFGESARGMMRRPRSCLSTPLVDESQLVGVMSLYSTNPDAFTEEHQRVAEVVSRQVAPILRRALEFEQNRATVLRDPVTGLPNIEHLRAIAHSQLASQHLHLPTALLLIDVNSLGEVNTKHGRQVGDEVLEQVAAVARANLRAADFLFRYGSDEFVALLLQTDKPTASSIALRINDAIAQREADRRLPRFDIAIVVVATPEDGSSVDELLEMASQRLATTNPTKGTTPSDSVH